MGWSTGIASIREPTTHISDDSYDSHNFLKRPVLIYTRDWNPLEQFFDVIDPWSLVCEDPRVESRLTNFMNLRTDLEITVTLNGGPFYSGRLILSYQPFGGEDIVFTDTGVNRLSLISMYQMQHIMCDPTLSEGGSMLFPFLHPNHSIRIPTKGWNRMGRLMIAPFNELRHSNDGTAPVSISIFAKLTNPTLHATTEMVPESEYGIISGPANVIGKVAGSLKDVPGIGIYAKATEMVAKLGVDVAKMFGFSRPRELTNIFHTDLASTDTPFNGGNLSLTAKKEALLSPMIMGATDEDQLSLAFHCRKWNYLTQFEWSTSDGSSVMLFNMGANPLQGEIDNGVLQLTNQGWVSNLFQSWHGSMEIMLQPVVSAHHRGRLTVVHDPIQVSATVNQFEQFNVANRAVIDLSNKSSLVFKVGWAQDGNYLPVVDPGASDWNDVIPAYSDTAFSPRDSDNGQLGIFVLNQLTAPSEFPQLVKVNVFFRLCEDASFQDPTQERLNGLSLNEDSLGPSNPDTGSLTDGILTPEEIRQTSLLTTTISTFAPQTLSAEEGMSTTVQWRSGVGVNAAIRGILVDSPSTGVPDTADILQVINMPYAYENQEVTVTVRATGSGITEVLLNSGISAPYPAVIDGLVSQSVSLGGIGDEASITFTPTSPFVAFGYNGASRPLIKDITYQLPTGYRVAVATSNDPLGLDVTISGAQGDDLLRLNSVPTNLVSGTTSIGLGGRVNSISGDALIDGKSDVFKGLGDSNLFTKITYLSNTTSPESIRMIPEGVDGEAQEDDPEPATPDIQLEENWIPDDSDVFYGEKVISLRTLLKRFTTHYSSFFGSKNSKFLRIPHYPREEVSLPNISSEPMSLFKYLNRGFLGVRGSMRISMTPSNTISESLYAHSSRVPSRIDAQIQAFGNDFINSKATLDGSHFSCLRSIGAYNLELPYYDRVRFLPCRSASYKWNGFDGKMNHYDITLNSPGPLRLSIAYATGEDFNFFTFVSVPRYTTGALYS